MNYFRKKFSVEITFEQKLKNWNLLANWDILDIVFQVRNQQRESNGEKLLLQWGVEKEMATHSNILAQQIPGAWWARSMRLQRVGHNWAHTHTDSQWGVGRRSLWLWDGYIKWHLYYRQEPHSGGLYSSWDLKELDKTVTNTYPFCKIWKATPQFTLYVKFSENMLEDLNRGKC